jgi:hypothetical protein
MLQYQPRGKRRLERPLKRLLEDIQLEAETDHSGLNSWSHMMMMMMILKKQDVLVYIGFK